MQQSETVEPEGGGHIVDQRQSVYGNVVDNYTRVAQIWSGILGVEVQPTQVPLMMMGLKLYRASITPDYSDNADDIEGYLGIFRSLVGEDMVHARSAEEYAQKRGAR